MNQLSPEARRLFQLARPCDEPNAQSLRRVESSLAARVARGVAIATVSTATTKAAATAASTLPLVKLMTSVGLAVSLTGVGWWGVRQSSHSAEKSLAVSSLNHPFAPVPRSRSEIATPSEATEAHEPATTSEPVAPAQRSLKPRALPAASITPPVAAPLDDPLHAEIRELRAAQQALRAGEGTRVLALLNQQDTTYSGGTLQEERAAARVLALCQTGRVDESRALAQRFEQRWPKSSLLARLKNACWRP